MLGFMTQRLEPFSWELFKFLFVLPVVHLQAFYVELQSITASSMLTFLGCKRIQSIGEGTPQYYASKYFLPLAEKKMGNDEVAHRHFESSIVELKSVVRGDPAHIDLYMYKALCEYQIEDYSSATKDIEFLLAMNPSVAAFHLAAAVINEALGRNDEALKHKEVAAQLDPAMTAPMV